MHRLLITADRRTSLTTISSKSRLALAGVCVYTIYTRSTITACVVYNALIYIWRWKITAKLCFCTWKNKRDFTLSKIESHESKCALRKLKIAYERLPFTLKTELKRGPGRGDTCHPSFLDEILPDGRYRRTTIKDKVDLFLKFILPCELHYFQSHFLPKEIHEIKHPI